MRECCSKTMPPRGVSRTMDQRSRLSCLNGQAYQHRTCKPPRSKENGETVRERVYPLRMRETESMAIRWNKGSGGHTPRPPEVVEVVYSRCKVCEWEGQLIVKDGEEPDCPCCH